MVDSSANGVKPEIFNAMKDPSEVQYDDDVLPISEIVAKDKKGQSQSSQPTSPVDAVSPPTVELTEDVELGQAVEPDGGGLGSGEQSKSLESNSVKETEGSQLISSG